MKRCHRCKTEWVSEKRQPGFKETCPECNAFLHCCVNCRYHDPHAHNQCRIPTTDWVARRDGANFCEDFEFVDRDPASDANTPSDKARRAVDDLLGGLGENGADKKKGLSDFEKLFGE